MGVRQVRKVRGVVYVARYPVTRKACAHCHKMFTGIALQVYCSRVCQNAAHYQRLRTAIVAEGTPLLSDEELRAEIAERKGRR